MLIIFFVFFVVEDDNIVININTTTTARLRTSRRLWRTSDLRDIFGCPAGGRLNEERPL